MEINDINPQSIVEEVLDTWPQTAKVFIKHGASCVGCDMACFETLQSASQIYNFSLDIFIDEIKNEALSVSD